MRTIQAVPEGGNLIRNRNEYKVIDNTEPIGEGVTKEWIIKYSTHEKHWEDLTFLVHAKNINEAFEHFISIKPFTYVKGVEYYGDYF